MIPVAGLLLLAAALILGGSALLRVRAWSVRRPRLALLLWLGVFGGGLVALAGSLAYSVGYAVSVRLSTGGSTRELLGLAAWAGLLLAGAVVSVVLTQAQPIGVRREATSGRLALLAAMSTYRRQQVRGLDVRFLTCAVPIACSARTDGPQVFLTSGLEQVLDAGGVRAVIEHERAHLVQRHDLLVAVAGLNRACLPAFFGARSFDRAVVLLVELIADDSAARVCGVGAVQSALEQLARADDNEWIRLRAHRLQLRAAAAGSPARARPAIAPAKIRPH